jgi:hypothetical protein
MLLGASPQSGQLGAAVAGNNPVLVEAANAAHKAGLRDVTTYPKQSFAVSWNGVRLGMFLSLGARSAGSSYECLQSFVPADESVAPSSFVVAGAGKLGAEICDYPRAVGVLPSPPDRIRIGILYANSFYLNGDKTSGADAPPIAAAVVIDPTIRTMVLDKRATEILGKAAPLSLQAMRALF